MTPTSPASTPFARPQRVEPASENRGSMLRASILESALELGVGSNRTVANWIFNSVDEVDEEEENEEHQGIVSPSLTYASTATSEESNLSAGLAQHAQPGAGILINGKDTFNIDSSVQHSKHNGLSPAGFAPEFTQRTLLFDLRATPEPRPISPTPSPQPHHKNKLRKAKPDVYDSDGGYLSDSVKAKKEKKGKNKKKGKDGDGDGVGTDYESEGGYLSEHGGKKKKSKKESKSKSKGAESPASEYETDKSFTSPFSRRSRKQSVTSPVSGDESDGGYLSESSKKKRFFRLNSRRKKGDLVDSPQDQPPPVPALPTMLPIHEKFSRSGTPLVSDSRNTTPVPSDTISARPSMETFTSMDTSTSVDTSATTDTSSTTVESDEKRDSLRSTNLTRAFRDAESVRSPSIDFLSTFRRLTPGSPLSASKSSPFSERPNLLESPVPPLSSSKSVRSRPKISSPNTITLAPKHIPVPLTLTPPTPTTNRIPPSPDPDYVLVTPNPSTSGEGHQSSSSVGSSGGPPSPAVPRPHVLAYYDLPPPSPPPRGPLPDVPSDISRSTSPSWSVMIESSPSLRFPRTTIEPRPMASPVDRLNPSAPHPLSRELAHDVPTIAQPVPPTQRGRVSPFPTAPLLPREQTTTLMRQTSKLTKEAVTRALRSGNAPASASPYTNEHNGRWLSNEVVVENGPTSAQAYSTGDWSTREQLGAHWQPRSASALASRQAQDENDDDGQSWLVYDDDDEEGMGDRALSVPNTRPTSTEPQASPDVNTILAGFRAQRDAQLAARRGNVSSTGDTLAGVVAGYEQDTVYLDVDDDSSGDRSSVWSGANSRHSFLDGERSATIRAKFVKRVEAMYGKDLVPPVPRLDQGLSSRSG